jgi:hypothetical protein
MLRRFASKIKIASFRGFSTARVALKTRDSLGSNTDGLPHSLFESRLAERGYSPLHVAAMQPEFPNQVLNAEATKVTVPMPDWDAILLRLLDHPQAGKWIDDWDAIESEKPKGSPLALAVQQGHVRRTRILLSAGSNVDSPDPRRYYLISHLLRGKYGYPRAKDWLPLGTVDALGRNASDVLLMLLGAGFEIPPGHESTRELIGMAVQHISPAPLNILLLARPQLHEELCWTRNGWRSAISEAIAEVCSGLLGLAPSFGGIAAKWPLPPSTVEEAVSSPHLHVPAERNHSHGRASVAGDVCTDAKRVHYDLQHAVVALERLRDYRGWTPLRLEEELRLFLTEKHPDDDDNEEWDVMDEKDKRDKYGSPKCKTFGRQKLGFFVTCRLVGNYFDYRYRPRFSSPRFQFGFELLAAARATLGPQFAPIEILTQPGDEEEAKRDEEEWAKDYRLEKAEEATGGDNADAEAEARAARNEARKARKEAREDRYSNLRYSLFNLEFRRIPGLLDAVASHMIAALRASYHKQTGFEYWKK